MNKRLTDPTFRYYNSADTCLKRTFARIRAEQKKAEKPSTVAAFKRKEKANG